MLGPSLEGGPFFWSEIFHHSEPATGVACLTFRVSGLPAAGGARVLIFLSNPGAKTKLLSRATVLVCHEQIRSPRIAGDSHRECPRLLQPRHSRLPRPRQPLALIRFFPPVGARHAVPVLLGRPATALPA